MKRVAAIFLVAFLGVAIGSWAAAAWLASQAGVQLADGRFAGPRLVLLTKRCELGIMPADEPLVARFTIHNDGGRRLIVRREHSACCGQAELDDVIFVNPGCSAKLTATIDAGGQRGNLEKTVTYATNDPALPRLELAVSANISHPIRPDGVGAPGDESRFPDSSVP
jgi:hypothetical protein